MSILKHLELSRLRVYLYVIMLFVCYRAFSSRIFCLHGTRSRRDFTNVSIGNAHAAGDQTRNRIVGNV